MKRVRSIWLNTLNNRPWVTFVLTGVFFILFGVTSYNLFVIFRANLNLFVEHGWRVVRDGALDQLLGLLLNAYLSVAFYALFKACEHALVKHLTHEKE
ncbi:hypothetical protein [Viridibacterium curvum]|uniref:Uncharacterized protein n=1 Tax=Viridibacterium curvum TaxID=1101404 RepID=A0ABP9QI88_9RHOO